MTLIELMVAALVLGIAVIGATSMMGTGQKLDYGNDLRRQARLRALVAFEDSLYNKNQHNSTYFSPVIGSDSTTVPLDSGKAATVTGRLKVTFFSGRVNFRDPVSGGLGIFVPGYQMKSTVLWTYEGVQDSVYVTKWLPRMGSP